MGSRVKQATLIELFAVFSVASPFIGYGLTEWFGNGLYFVLGAGIFCAWMLLVSVLFLGAYKRRVTNQTAEASSDDTDAASSPQDA